MRTALLGLAVVLTAVAARADEKEDAAVKGIVAGSSADGSTVYFVAGGALTPGAAPGNNLYVDRYSGGEWRTTQIAALSADDASDWAGGGSLARLTARVSSNGRWLAFMSDRPLTGYDTRDVDSGEPDEEVYLYEGETGRLICC